MKLFGRSASSHNVKNAPPPTARPESLRNLAPTNHSDTTFDPARYSQQVTGKPEPAAPSSSSTRFSETYRASGPPPLPGTLPPRSELEQRLKDFYLEHDPAKAGDMEKIIVATQRNGLHWLKDGLMRKYGVTIDFDKPLPQQASSMERSQSVYQAPTVQPPPPPPARSQSVFQRPSATTTTATAVVQPPPLPQHAVRSQSVYQPPPPLREEEDNEAQKRAAMRRKQEEEELADRQRNKYPSMLVQKNPVQIQQRKVELAREELDRLLNQVEVAKEELEREKRVLEQLLDTQQQRKREEEDNDRALQQQREADEQQQRRLTEEQQQRRLAEEQHEQHVERERLQQQQREAEEREAEEQRRERGRLQREAEEREAEEQQRRREQELAERRIASPPPLPTARSVETPPLPPLAARHVEVEAPPAPLARPESMRMFIPMAGAGGGGGLEAKARALEAQSRALAKQAQEEEDARLEREAARGAAAQLVEDDDDKAEETDNFAHQVLFTRKTASAASAPLPEPSATPCDNFTLNMAANTFGSCYCGHPKNQHQRAAAAPTASTNMFKDMSKAVKRNSDLAAPTPPEVPSRRPSDLAAAPAKPEFSDTDQNRARLVAFYEIYNPEKIGEIDAILVKFKGKEANLFKKLQEKYPGSTI